MKTRRTTRLMPEQLPLTPDFAAVPPPTTQPDLHFEEILWHLYRREKIAAENFRKQRDEARAKLRRYVARGRVKHIAKGFKPSHREDAQC
jgi:hypothetical protein